MAKYCTLSPYIKTQDGTLKESRLYKDLLSLTSNDRKKANAAYCLLTSESFKEDLNKKQIDELGEPILSSVIASSKLKKILDASLIKTGVLTSLGVANNEGPIHYQDTTDNYLSLAEKVVSFNSTSPYKDNYTALLKNDSGGLFVDLVPISTESSVEAAKLASNLSLNNKIRGILANSGVTISALNTLQDSLRSSGVVDYENATVTTEGLINLIRLAEGIRGERALPEEFAHFAFDMMQGDPLYDRLMLLLDNDELIAKILGDSYEKYSAFYSNDRDRLKREAAGHLISESWFNERTPLPEHKSFIRRVIDKIKSLLSSINRYSLSEALSESQRVATEIGTRIINNPSVEVRTIEKLNKLSNLHHLENGAKTRKEILEKSIANSLKKYQFYSDSLVQKIRAEKNEDAKEALQERLYAYQDKMMELISNLKDKLVAEQFDIGVQNFIMSSVSELSDGIKRAKSLTGDMSLQERAYNIRNLYNVLNSIAPIADDITLSLQYNDTDLTLTEETKTALEKIQKTSKELKEILDNEAQKTFANYLKAFFPKEGITVEGRYVSKDDILELLRRADKDIGIIDTWLQSAANADDIIINLADQAMKYSKDRKRQRVLNVKEELLAAAKELKDAGESDEFMFERHADGTLSGRYKSETNWTAYYDEKKKFREYLDNKYEHRGKEYLQELSAWRKENEDSFGRPSYKYNVNFRADMNEAQRAYYDAFMKVREEMLSYLPLTTLNDDPMRAVQVSKDLWERIKTSSPATWYKQISEAAKNSVISRVDDTDFGYKNAIKGFNDEEVMAVPIFFINPVEEDALSRDTASTMIAFADMAINYDEMSKVSDLFEVGREAMQLREAGAERRGKPLVETVKGLGMKVTQKINKTPSYNFVERYNEFLNTQLYNRFMRDDTVPINENKDIHKGKLARLVNRISSLNQLAVNLLAGVAAVGSDMINVNSEVLASTVAGGKAPFSAKQLHQADKIYRKNIVGVLGEFGNPIKTTKLGLFIDKFDVLHEYETEVRNIEWKKSKAKKLLSENSLYFFMQAGAHFGETRTALAQAQNMMIKSDDGTREESLWDVLTVQYLDENDHSKGAKLVAKEGFTLSQKDITEFSRKFNGLNQKLYGIYSKTDINALETTALGQLISLYRKFIVSSLNRRYGKQKYNFDTGEIQEGYYRSAWGFIKNVIKDTEGIGGLIDTIKMHWQDMEDFQKSNIMRTTNELGTFVILLVLSSVLRGADWDDSDNPWQKRFLAYMSTRLKTETGAFSPFGVLGETWNIVKSPAACINTLEGAADMLKAVYPSNWLGEDAIVQSGRYKGHTKSYKYFMNSPFVPMNKTVYRALHPEESIIAFK